MTRNRAMLIAAIAVILIILLLLLRGKPDAPQPVALEPKPTAQAKLIFDPPTTMDIARDYDQRGQVALRNDDGRAHIVRVETDVPAGLFTGFVGRGTRDWYEQTNLEIGPGETWHFPFIVHANAATQSHYTIPIRVTIPNGEEWTTVGEGVVNVNIAKPDLKIETKWLESDNPVDAARLVRILEIRNLGVAVPDLSLAIDPEATGRVRIAPRIEALRLDERQTIRVRVWPRLYPAFQSISTTLNITGHNQSLELPFTAAVPDGHKLYVTTSRSTGMSGSSGSRCTNQSSASYSSGATQGTPSAASSGTGGGGGFGGGSSSGGGLSAGTSNEGGADDTAKEEDGEEDDDELVWSDNPFGEGDQTQDEDKGTIDTVAEIMDDVAEGTLPPSATGSAPTTPEALLDSLKDQDGKLPTSDIISKHVGDIFGRSIMSEDDPRHPDYQSKLLERMRKFTVPLLSDPVAATKETAAHVSADGKRGALITRHANTNGKHTSGLVFENFGFGIQGKGRTIKSSRIPLVRGEHAVRGATLGSGPNKEPVAAFSKPTDQGGEVVELRDVEGNRTITLGDPAKISKSPKLISRDNAADVVYLEDGQVKRAPINADFTPGKAQVLVTKNENEPFADLVAARAAPDGDVAVLAQANDSDMTFAVGDKRTTIKGRGGDMDISSDGQPTIVVRRDNGAIEQVSDEGNTIAQLAPPSNANGAPALVKTKAGNLRAIFHQNFGLSPNLLVKSQLPTTTAPGTLGGGGTFQFDLIDGKWTGPQTLPQPEQPVTEAAVVLDASLPFGRAHYRKQDVKVYLNDYKIGELNDRVPNGRYVFPVPPRMLRHRTAWDTDAADNRVDLKIKGIGKGNYALTEGVNIYTRHALVQEYLAAPTFEKAMELSQISTPDIRHSCPDLVLSSNDWELPRGVQTGETVTARIGLFNAGDADVPPGTLTASGANVVLGQTTYEGVAPFATATVDLPIAMPATWKPGEPLKITITTDVPNDPNLPNHEITFVALRDYMPAIAGPVRPAQVRMTNVTGVETIDITTAAYVKPLNEASTWYRFKAPPKGQLNVELIDAADDIVLSMDLFSEAGELLFKQNNTYALPSEWLYLRIGLRPNVKIPSSAKLKIGWDVP